MYSIDSVGKFSGRYVGGMNTEAEVYTVTIPGEPVAKARARVTKAGHAYTPKRTVDYERMVQTLFQAEHGSPMLEGPIMLQLDLYFGIPKSRSKDIQERMRQELERPCKRPDIDNCMKAVCDALNGIAYKDDSQIVAAVLQKFWADEPRAVVTIEELDLEEDATQRKRLKP